MSTQTLSVAVPDRLLARIRDRARETNRTVESEVVELLSAALTVQTGLPADLAEAVAGLHLLDEPALRRAANSRLSDEALAELEALHFKQRREGLTEAEDRDRQELMRQYERAMLVRSEATALLHARGLNGQVQAHRESDIRRRGTPRTSDHDRPPPLRLLPHRRRGGRHADGNRPPDSRITGGPNRGG